MVVLPPVESTNTWAAEQVRAGGLTFPALVTTPHQTAGRGQFGRSWHGDPSAIAVTFVLPPLAKLGLELHELPRTIGDLVAGVVRRYVEAEVVVKWPNDVLIGGKKVAGVLCENPGDVVLVGIGLNVALDRRHLPEDIIERATDLASHAKDKPSRVDVLIELAGAIVLVMPRDV